MRLTKNFLFITLPLMFVVVLAVEFILARFFPVDDPYIRFKHRYYQPFIPSQMLPHERYRLTSKEGLPGMDTAMTYSTNNVGFRGDPMMIPKPAHETRVVIIGGSTTQCLYIDDTKSLDRILQDELQLQIPGRNIRVYAAAKSGDATDEHIAMLAHRVVHMQPDLIVLFSGINDLRKVIQRYDYLHLRRVKEYSPPYIFLTATNFQVGRRLYYLLKRKSDEEKRQEVPLETNYRELFAIQQKTPESDSIPYLNTQSYEENLRSFAGICEANAVKVLFMPNQSTWNSGDTVMKGRHWLLTCGKVRYKEQYLGDGLDSVNNIMKKVAAERDVPFFDLPSEISGTGAYFYDDCHFNVAGAAEAGKKLALFISREKVLNDSVSTFQYK